jgi:hypothetical protein
MDFIKNKEDFKKNANELINGYGEPKEIAEAIETVLFAYIELATMQHECMAAYHWDIITKVRETRDLINSIKTN